MAASYDLLLDLVLVKVIDSITFSKAASYDLLLDLVESQVIWLFTPKFGKRVWQLAAFQNYANQGVDKVKINICWIQCDTGSILSEWHQ